MRRRFARLYRTARTRLSVGAQLLPGVLEEHQGVLGVAALSLGAGINWGPGWALILVSPFLLLAAWGSR